MMLILAHKICRILVVGITPLVLQSCDDNESHYPISEGERNVWRDIGMRLPEPVIVDVPTSISDLDIPSDVFLIIIKPRCIDVDYNDVHHDCFTMKQLDSMLMVNGGGKFDGRVALKADSTSYSRIDSVIAVLKSDSIVRFNLITDLESK